ncbi:MAG TPA: substrate-binding domain-containing protein [Xanthobacteraceae bacterium]|jgi:molybdate transport system substrate-binding protein|nr:substrate-binding domain-containing protein [Xanthobacteraceae bacterium]
MADLKVYSTIGVRSAAEDLFSQFEAASGHRLAVTWGTAPMLVKKVEGGETADVLILSRAGLDTLSQQGKVLPGSETPLASSGVGIAVKAGAPKPDISTPEALKQTLLNAKSISYTEPSAGGASGVYFAKLLERMGIAEEMRPKTKYPPAGGFSATLLISGEAELAVQQKPELLHVAGVEVIGFLPGDLNLITAFVAGLMPDCQHAENGKALIASLRTPQAAAAFHAKGLEPA